MAPGNEDGGSSGADEAVLDCLFGLGLPLYCRSGMDDPSLPVLVAATEAGTRHLWEACARSHGNKSPCRFSSRQMPQTVALQFLLLYYTAQWQSIVTVFRYYIPPNPPTQTHIIHYTHSLQVPASIQITLLIHTTAGGGCRLWRLWCDLRRMSATSTAVPVTSGGRSFPHCARPWVSRSPLPSILFLFLRVRVRVRVRVTPNHILLFHLARSPIASPGFILDQHGYVV